MPQIIETYIIIIVRHIAANNHRLFLQFLAEKTPILQEHFNTFMRYHARECIRFALGIDCYDFTQVSLTNGDMEDILFLNTLDDLKYPWPIVKIRPAGSHEIPPNFEYLIERGCSWDVSLYDLLIGMADTADSKGFHTIVRRVFVLHKAADKYDKSKLFTEDMYFKLASKIPSNETQIRDNLCTLILPSKCKFCATNATLRRCSGCRGVFYCSDQCHKKDWATHKVQCLAAFSKTGVVISVSDPGHTMFSRRGTPPCQS